jgi:RNA polymerase sigma-70 factor (ECF subfamily)
VDSDVRARCEAGELDAATASAVEGYGEEIYSFLVARMDSEDRAADVFSQTCEDLWQSLRTFEWRCSLRTWFYRLARNAAVRYEKVPANDLARRQALSQIGDLADQVRSRTQLHLRSEVKDRFQELRSRLPTDDQMLLILRVDRALAWEDIVRILDDEVSEDDDALQRASARLRQKFPKLKDRLRELARSEGLLDSDS